MPPIRFVRIDSNSVVFQDHRGVTRTLTYTSLPSQQNTIAKAEAWVNNWLASNISGYQMAVHVFSRSPLRLTVYCADLGEVIPANWWVE